jgi:MFS transporter, DHA1 family, tetracycline resistance protein
MTDDSQASTLPAAPAGPLPDERERRRALLTVFLVVFIDLLGFGIVLPQLPLIGRDFLDPLIPGGADAPLSGLIIGLLLASFSAMQFVFAPVWGRLSDRVGRRPILLLGLGGSVLFYALYGVGSELGAYESRLLGLVLLFVARIGAGIAGATIATAQAVIADSTTPEGRSRGMALIGAAFGIGFTFGPAMGALILWAAPDFRGGPGFLVAAASFVALMIAVRRLPETLRPGVPGDRGRHLDALFRTLRTPAIGLVVFSFFLATFAFANFESTLSFLALALGFRERGVSMVFAYVGFVLILSAGVLYRRLALKLSETVLLGAGVTAMALGLTGLAAVGYLGAESDRAAVLTLLFVSLTVSVTGFSFLNPSVQTLISKRSDPTRQGEYLGVNQSAAALARVFGPACGPYLFNLGARLGLNDALPYVTATLLMAAVLLALPRVRQG